MTVISPLVRLNVLADLDSADAGVRGKVLPFLKALVAAAHASGVPVLTAFTPTAGGRARTSGFEQWLEADAESASKLLLTFGPRFGATVGITKPTVEVSFDLTVERGQPEQIRGLLAAASAMLLALAAGWKMGRAAMLRAGEPGFSCLPRSPVVRFDSHAGVVTKAQVADFYADEAAFFAAWPDVRELFGQFVLFRGLDTVANVDFLRVLIDSQWALARAARPALTKYSEPRVEDFEQDIYHGGTATLHPVAHVATEDLVEFTCTPPPGEFIRGWEVFDIRHLIAKGALEDGRKVANVRVVFRDRDAAEANKRVLLDVGARVAYMSASGEPAYVEE